MSGMICLSLSWLVVGNEGVVALGHVLVHTHHCRHRTELSWEKFSTGCHKEVETLEVKHFSETLNSFLWAP